MCLARRAARKLVPVVLTLGSGPSGFERKLSGRRPKLPRQPRRGRVARARSRNFDAGSWPVGLLETTFRATAEASATAMANPRRRTRALRYFGAGGWPVGLPETIFRATAKASATASLALASFVLALGLGPTSFPKQVSERCKAGGSWTPTAMANPRRRTRALRYFGAGGWPVGLPETIFRAKLPRQPWQTRAVARARSTQSGGILEAAAAYAARSLCRNTGGPDYQGRGPGQWPQWPFYQPEADQWPDP